MKIYNLQDWHNLAKELYELITAELDGATSENLPEAYPKLVVMYEFFRLVRGEAFHSLRPAGVVEFQREIYKMEDDFE